MVNLECLAYITPSLLFERIRNTKNMADLAAVPSYWTDRWGFLKCSFLHFEGNANLKGIVVGTFSSEGSCGRGEVACLYRFQKITLLHPSAMMPETSRCTKTLPRRPSSEEAIPMSFGIMWIYTEVSLMWGVSKTLRKNKIKWGLLTPRNLQSSWKAVCQHFPKSRF